MVKLLIRGSERSSQVGLCVSASSVFLLGQQEAIDIINHQVKVIGYEWLATCDEAGLSEVDRNLFWRRQFLNPFAFLNAPEGVNIPI